MTKFEVVYDQFLSTVSINFQTLSNDEIKQELFNWTVLASSYFKFPRVDLDFEVYTVNNKGPDGEVGAYFKGDLTQKEITVIVEYMKLVHFEIQLADSKKYEMYYEDANLKLPSQSALITQINRSYENQQTKAKKTEYDYYRVKDGKPTFGSVWTS